MKKVTLKDIAAAVGVTVGTVSHVMNGIPDISPATRDKVLEAAKRLGYVGNRAAASLRSGKSGTVAVIVPDISNPHIAHQIKLIEDKIRPLGYSVMILNTDENKETEREAITVACAKGVDGILLCPAAAGADNLTFLEQMDVPYLLIGRYFAGHPADYVCADDVGGGYLAGRYLLENGYKAPLYVGAPESIEASGHRFAGLCRALEERGISLSRDRFIPTDPRGTNVEQTVTAILSTGIPFDSVVAFSDLIAFKITAALRAAGVPPLPPVVGFDAVNTHLFMPLPHISIGMAAGGWAAVAAEALLAKIEGRGTPCHTYIPVQIYEFR